LENAYHGGARIMITVELPNDIERELQTDWTDLDRHALEGFVTEAFRQRKLSSYQVGRSLGMEDRWDIINFLSERGVYPGYEMEDYEQDLATIAALGAIRNNSRQ
jgi:hypothetical protein